MPNKDIYRVRHVHQNDENNIAFRSGKLYTYKRDGVCTTTAGYYFHRFPPCPPINTAATDFGDFLITLALPYIQYIPQIQRLPVPGLG